MIHRRYDDIVLTICDTREEMGRQAAAEAADCLRRLLEREEKVNCMFAAAPSQTEFLTALCREEEIDWGRVNAFHMDEYAGLSDDMQGSFGGYLREHIFDRCAFGKVNLIDGKGKPGEEAVRYGKLIASAPLHMVFLGIGENGHIAFNDPHEADFQDPQPMKTVKLDEVCRMQQVHDGCFPSLTQVPELALTVTCPMLASAEYVFCIVPGMRKREALTRTLTGPVEESCPASILRRAGNVRMYADRECARELTEAM